MINKLSDEQLRVILGARQSVAHDGSMSIENQHLMGRAEGARRNWNIVGEIVDDDVSGAHDPFLRPALGPILRGEAVEFDAIVFTNPVRASRDTLDGLLLLRWAQTSGKRLIILSPFMDSATMTPGERVQYVLGLELGQYEREQIIARIRQGVELGRLKGRWLGARVPLWAKPIAHPDDPEAFALDLDEENSILVKGIIDAIRSRLADGRRMPYGEICRVLNDKGVQTPFDLRRTSRPRRKRKPHKNAAKDRIWQTTSLIEMVSNRLPIEERGANRLLIGEKEVFKYEYINGKRGRLISRTIIRDPETNKPVLFCPPLLTYEEFKELDQLLREPRTKQPVRNATPLQGVVFCMDCKAPRNPFTNKARRTNETYEYSMCSRKTRYKTCDSPNVKAHMIYEYLDSYVLSVARDEQIYDRIDPPKVDYVSRLMRLRDEVEALKSLYTVTKSESGRAKLASQIGELDEGIAELEELERNPPEPEYRPTGMIFGQMWASRDWHGRGNLLRQVGIRVEVKGTTEGKGFLADVIMPTDARERLRKATSNQPVPASFPASVIAPDEAKRKALISGKK